MTMIPDEKKQIQDLYKNDQLNFILSEETNNELTAIQCLDGELVLPNKILDEIIVKNKRNELDIFITIKQKILSVAIRMILFHHSLEINSMDTSDISQLIFILSFFRLKKHGDILVSIVKIIIK